jgi:CheY-like chemotaxis protein
MMKVAVVEGELVAVLLTGHYEIRGYETGPQALDGMRQEKPDVILLDISLPQMDGPEVVRKIRADSLLRDIPVIALTAHAMVGDREKYLAAGFNDYLTKPIVDEEQLLATIERWIGRNSHEQSRTRSHQEVEDPDRR